MNLHDFLKNLQNSREERKKRWFIGLVSAAAFMTVFLWLTYMDGLVRPGEREEARRQNPSLLASVYEGFKEFMADILKTFND